VLGVLGGLICLRSFRAGSPAALTRRPAPVAAEAPAVTEGDDA
jgi:hypothetical protein